MVPPKISNLTELIFLYLSYRSHFKCIKMLWVKIFSYNLRKIESFVHLKFDFMVKY